MNTKDRLDAFVMAVMPKFMGFDGYPRRSTAEAAALCVKTAQAVMATVDKVAKAEAAEDIKKVLAAPDGEWIAQTPVTALTYESTGAAMRDLEILDRPVASLNCSVRGRKALKALQVATLGGLTRITRKELANVHGIGESTINEILAKMQKLDLCLMEDS